MAVDYALWLPLFLGIFAVMFDVSMTFHRQARIWDVARETARLAALGALSAAEAEAHAVGRLPGTGDYSITVDDSGPEGVTVRIAEEGDHGLPLGLAARFVAPARAEFTMRREL